MKWHRKCVIRVSFQQDLQIACVIWDIWRSNNDTSADAATFHDAGAHSKMHPAAVQRQRMRRYSRWRMAARGKTSMLSSPTGLKGRSKCATLRSSKSSCGGSDALIFDNLPSSCLTPWTREYRMRNIIGGKLRCYIVLPWQGKTRTWILLIVQEKENTRPFAAQTPSIPDIKIPTLLALLLSTFLLSSLSSLPSLPFWSIYIFVLSDDTPTEFNHACMNWSLSTFQDNLSLFGQTRMPILSPPSLQKEVCSASYIEAIAQAGGGPVPTSLGV